MKHGVYSSIANCPTKISATFRGIFGIFLRYFEIYICLLHGFWRNPSTMFNDNPELHRTTVGKSPSQPLTCIRNMEVTIPARCGIRPFPSSSSVGIPVVPASTDLRGSMRILFFLFCLLTLRRRIKSHLLFAGIIRSSPFSPR